MTAARRGSRSTGDCSSQYIPDPNAEVGHCVHHIAMHPSRPDVLFMQKHWDVMRSDDAGDIVAGGQRESADRFRFRDRRARARAGDDLRGADQERLASIIRRRASCACIAAGRGGNEWEALTKGLPQSDCYVNVLRDAMAVDSLDSCGVYFGTTGGQVYASAGCGRQLGADCARSAGGAFGGGADAAMIRVVLPAHLRTLARVSGEVKLEVEGPVTQRSVLDALEARYPMLRGTIRDHVTQQRRPFVVFCVRGGSVARVAGCAAAGCGGDGQGAFPDRGRHCRRLGGTSFFRLSYRGYDLIPQSRKNIADRGCACDGTARECAIVPRRAGKR